MSSTHPTAPLDEQLVEPDNHPISRARDYPIGRTLPGFKAVFRYYDANREKVFAKILPGEFYITESSKEWIVTTLGSCISVCIRDVKGHIGGMNHFMLPGTPKDAGQAFSQDNPASRYGLYAMENLVNGILKFGGDRRRLEIKVTGGGRIRGLEGGIADSNVKFIRHFLRVEGFEAKAVDLGGCVARRVQYDPLSGRLRVKKLPTMQDQQALEQELPYRQSLLNNPPPVGSMELF